MRTAFKPLISGLLLGIGYVVLEKAKAEPELREIGLKLAANLQVALAAPEATAPHNDAQELADDLTTIQERLGPFMMRNLIKGLALEAVTDPAGLMSSVRHIPQLKSHLNTASA